MLHATHPCPAADVAPDSPVTLPGSGLVGVFTGSDGDRLPVGVVGPATAVRPDDPEVTR